MKGHKIMRSYGIYYTKFKDMGSCKAIILWGNTYLVQKWIKIATEHVLPK